jgi:hypothetical protein
MPAYAQRTAPALLVSLALAMLPLAASADGVGLMLEGGAYYAQVDDDIEIEDLEDLKAKFDDNSYGYNLGIGWRFNKWLAVDGGYWDLGDFNSDRFVAGGKAKVEFDTFTVGGIVSVPLWILDVYARGGAAFWNADSSDFGDDDGTDPYYGIGASLNIGGSLDLYLEVLRFDLETSVDTVGLGARFTF